MLSDDERKTFDLLVARFDQEIAEPPLMSGEPSADERAARRLGSRLLSAGMGLCTVAMAVSGLVGSPEAVISFCGGMAALAFLRYA